MPPRAARQRQKRRAYERAYFKPDRVAMWAVLLGLLLVLVAAMSGHP
jgi:type VI protein secretion system component VasF